MLSQTVFYMRDYSKVESIAEQILCVVFCICDFHMEQEWRLKTVKHGLSKKDSECY